MKLELSVVQSGGKLLVYASNTGGVTCIIDQITLIVRGRGWSVNTAVYQEDFYAGSGRVTIAGGRLMFKVDYSRGPAKAHAVADYFEVDQTATGATTTVS